MAVETRPQSEEVELEQGGRLTQKQLDSFKITRYGGEVMDGQAILIWMDELEGKLFDVAMADNLIVPNPNQPREYFDPEKMAELERTIREVGQKQAINVVPILFKDGTRKLFIIDGERRFRTAKELKLPLIKTVPEWVPDEESLFYEALILNESKADHNPIERAKAYKKIVDFENQKPSPLSKQAIADKIGISVATLSKHLEYLEHLTSDLQDMLAKGQITQEAADRIVREKKTYGIKLDLGQMAQDIGGKRGPVDFVVGTSVRKALRVGGHEEDAARAEVNSAIAKFRAGLAEVFNAVEVILTSDKACVIEHLFDVDEDGRGLDTIRDRMEAVRDRLDKARKIIDEAIEPPPLEKIPGKPTFVQHIEYKKRMFGNDVRLQLAKALAKAADEHGKFLTGKELMDIAGISPADFTGNIRPFKQEIPETGLELQEHTLRRKDTQDKYKKKTAYRLAWPKTPLTREQRLDALRAAGARVEAERSRIGVSLKDFAIVTRTTPSEPALAIAARAIANNIVATAPISETIRNGTEFERRFGVAIEIEWRGDQKVYIIKSNVRGFAGKYKALWRMFQNFIAEALNVEKHTVTVEVQDL